MIKEEYKEIDIEILKFEAEDIITASGNDGGDETPLNQIGGNN